MKANVRDYIAVSNSPHTTHFASISTSDRRCENSLHTPAMTSLSVVQVLGLIFTSSAALGFPDMAKELIMGNRGAAGLAWATTTTVGSLAAMKTCLAAAAPDWLREALLLRDATIDAAIGFTSNVSRPSKRRVARAKALGIVSKRQVLTISIIS